MDLILAGFISLDSTFKPNVKGTVSARLDQSERDTIGQALQFKLKIYIFSLKFVMKSAALISEIYLFTNLLVRSAGIMLAGL